MVASSDVQYVRNSINQIWSVLEKQPDHSFFKTQQYIINCKYVRAYYSRNESRKGSNYVHYVIMENGEEITIPKARYQDFLRKMESFTIPIE